MIFNLLRNALLAWLLHAGVGVVLDAGNAAPALPVATPPIAAAAPMQSCAMPVASPDMPAPALRSLLPTIAGAHS